MLLTTEGVVIREKQVGETDKFIDVLTRDYGILEISVKGVRKVTSKSASSTQLFAYAVFCVQKRGERFYLNSCEPKHIFYDLRLDINKFALASYFSEILQFSVTSNEPAEDILRLFLNSLHFLTQGDKSLSLIKSIFEFRILADIGMMPDVVGCRNCRQYSSEKMYFNMNDGVLYCEKCVSDPKRDEIFLLTPSLLHAVRYIVLTEFDRLWNFKLSEEALQGLNFLSENYLAAQLGRNFKTLDFYRSCAGMYQIPANPYGEE